MGPGCFPARMAPGCAQGGQAAAPEQRQLQRPRKEVPPDSLPLPGQRGRSSKVCEFIGLHVKRLDARFMLQQEGRSRAGGQLDSRKKK